MRLLSRGSPRSASPPPPPGPGKKWEPYELNKNGKPVRIQMHVQTGDLVQVIAGGDKGTVGRVARVFTKTGQVLVEGANIRTKHVKPAGEEEGGQIVRKEFPMHHSNVAAYSETANVASRIGIRVEGDKKVRFLKKTGEPVVKRAAPAAPGGEAASAE